MIKVYDIEFKNKAELFKVLGYLKPIAKGVFERQYHTFENLVKIRLNSDDENYIKDRLKELLSEYQEINKKTLKKNNQTIIDNDILNLLVIAFNCLDEKIKDSIIKTYATTTKKDTSYINEAIQKIIEENE